jgi:hypothetical protein
MDERTQRMERALILARGACTKPDCEYGRYCPRFWKRIFILYFEDEPTGDNDRRWDALFKTGFNVQRILLEKEKDEKTAA